MTFYFCIYNGRCVPMNGMTARSALSKAHRPPRHYHWEKFEGVGSAIVIERQTLNVQYFYLEG